jgi:hypothetical protein
MSAVDFRINAAVRRVFIRHWLDLQLIDYRTTNCVVYITGKLRGKGARKGTKKTDYAVNPAVVEAVEREIGRIRGVKRVHMKLEGWTRSGGKWVGGGY